MRLSSLKLNDTAIITGIYTDRKTEKILNNMGVLKGDKITLIRKAPFNSPIEIKVKDFYLAIRKNLADKIEIKTL